MPSEAKKEQDPHAPVAAFDAVLEKVKENLQKAVQSRENWEMILKIIISQGGIRACTFEESRRTHLDGISWNERRISQKKPIQKNL